MPDKPSTPSQLESLPAPEGESNAPRLAAQRPYRFTRILGLLLLAAVVTVSVTAAALVWPSSSTGSTSPSTPTAPYGIIIGNPLRLGPCPSSNSFQVSGCGSGHYGNELTIESDPYTFGNVGFAVLTSTGGVLSTPGALGFSIVNETDAVVAQYAVSVGVMNMTGGWTWYAPGYASGTPLTNFYSVVLDLGTVNPANDGDLFVAHIPEGTTSSLLLP